MSLYNHFQDAKNAENLPEADGLGMCLNCKFWDAEGTTTLSQKEQVAVCIFPALKPFALIVSGTSACNKWKERESVDPDAKAFSKQGEK
ncbi:hypothetical protein B1R32_1395 [Abditibacterium utsteinense]|uniref:Uncharacterized protein n=1 Tax=Abditibacterium utsteinense TaxID=1960156 RepID=A0A2S8SNP0_9BACT|nr:hypothetical protein [Abditibacterium utsteinense]PQV62407.1 hypothetical protein B1R32_1395 [Abditibacterium utsteinense]